MSQLSMYASVSIAIVPLNDVITRKVMTLDEFVGPDPNNIYYVTSILEKFCMHTVTNTHNNTHRLRTSWNNMLYILCQRIGTCSDSQDDSQLLGKLLRTI